MQEKQFNVAYTGQRPDIMRLVPIQNIAAVLDVGCSTGSLGAAVKARTGARVVGIEASPEMSEVALQRLDQVLVGDATEIFLKGDLGAYKFDVIIFADVLEHLIDPWKTLTFAREYLSESGVVIASLPNVRHMSTVFSLVFGGYWPYRDRSIHDKTHLRFFTRRNVVDLFEAAGLSIKSMGANYRLIERPHKINRFAKFLAMPGLKSFLTFQYLVTASHEHESSVSRDARA